MATKTRLGGVFMKDTDNNIASGGTISTENICGLIFDTKGLTTPLGGGKAAQIFANGNIVEFNTTNDLKDAGIDETIMCGLPLYHIKSFFSLAGQNQRLFVSFMDSQTDTEFEAIELMQTAADGVIYQIGLWTTEPTASKSGDSEELEITSLYTKLQAVAETLGGKIGVVNYDGNSPINILLNAPVTSDLTLDYKKLPDINSLNLPKVSHLLGQQSNTQVRNIQAALMNALTGNKMAIVGNIGAALGVLAVASAEESIGMVGKYNLSGVMQSCELGFGNIELEGEDGTKTFKSTSSFNNIKSITYTKRDTFLHKKGYVFLTPIEGIQNGVFFSSDQTLSTGDYRTISRCRVMHKSRRVVRIALLSKVNATVLLDSSTGQMSAADITEYQNLVLDALDNNMVQPGTKNTQISGRTCTIDGDQDILSNDEIKVEYSIVPIGCTGAIYVTEGFAGSISE